MTVNVSTNRWATSNFIVAPTIAQGAGYTTIAAAITAAGSSGTILIKPGTYTENLTLPANVNLVAYECDAFTPSTTIVGNITCTDAGSRSISGIRLQTNSAALLTVSGSANTVVNLRDCYLNCADNTGITYSSSGASSKIELWQCQGDIGTTGISLFTATGAGQIRIGFSNFTNSGVTTTASTTSACTINVGNSAFNFPFSTSTTGGLTFTYSTVDCSVINATAITANSSGTHSFKNGFLNSGSAATVTVTSGTVNLDSVVIASTNTTPIGGAGTVQYSSLSFSTTGVAVAPTTLTPLTFRYGMARSTTQPAFQATVGSARANKTGNGATYLLGTDALTLITNQGAYMTTAGTFTAPVTGQYQLNANVLITNCTIAQTITNTIDTSNRIYKFLTGRAANLNSLGSAVAQLTDMDAADTATTSVVVTGEAADTNSVAGQSFFSGMLSC